MKKIYLVLKETLKKPLVMFLLGVFVAFLFTSLIGNSNALTKIDDSGVAGLVINTPTVQTPEERNKPSPENYLNESQIKVYKDRVEIDASNVVWAGFADTKSMLPVINKDSNAIQVIPICPEEVKVGDIISYKSLYADGIIIHRVIYESSDENGSYFILKGDNNPSSDPGKIRCSQIQRKVIGILY